MKKANVINLEQKSVLEQLSHSGAISANDFNRHVLESLVRRGLAIKHHLGHAVTFTISPQGKAIYSSL